MNRDGGWDYDIIKELQDRKEQDLINSITKNILYTLLQKLELNEITMIDFHKSKKIFDKYFGVITGILYVGILGDKEARAVLMRVGYIIYTLDIKYRISKEYRMF